MKAFFILCIFLIWIFLTTGCVTTKDYGRGKCLEYMPTCAVGKLVCTTDEYGCRKCSCKSYREQFDPNFK